MSAMFRTHYTTVVVHVFVAAFAIAAGPVHGQAAGSAAAAERPNVVLIMTDDQGYGDLGAHGNTIVRTPNLDRLHDEGVRFETFYVCPVCSPTRAGLMTGRYNYRTGAIDTYLGRSMMYPDEVTIAEALRAAGYRTGIFGKWHLGDNYPLRPIDQGFDEALVHLGGGLAQPSGPPGNGYFNPELHHNGRALRYQGYCTDIFTTAAIRFIADNRDRPFFVYLATNAPHSPLQVPEADAAPYREQGLPERLANLYGMITNLDNNIGALLNTLGRLDLGARTLVIFLTDNGPQGVTKPRRYNANLRAGKGTVYEGGIRVPCFVRWPGRLEPSRTITGLAANIDWMPTILEACGVAPPPGVKFDGISLWPALTGRADALPDRTLFFQWHRGDEPVPFKKSAVRTPRFKLIHGTALYDLIVDPAEQHDVAAAFPDVVADLRARYKAWFADVGASHGYAPPRIFVGTSHENPVTLTRQDWRGAKGWGDKDCGFWLVHVASPGPYDVRLQFAAAHSARTAHLRVGSFNAEQPIPAGAEECLFKAVTLPTGDQKIAPTLTERAAASAAPRGAAYVTIAEREP
jgi:arylsulfatase A-like enzyme